MQAAAICQKYQRSQDLLKHIQRKRQIFEELVIIKKIREGFKCH
jgi:hypothetical protein